MAKVIVPFPCRCGGTFNHCDSTRKGKGVAVHYECSICDRKIEQELDLHYLDTKPTLAEKEQWKELGRDGLVAKLIEAMDENGF